MPSCYFVTDLGGAVSAVCNDESGKPVETLEVGRYGVWSSRGGRAEVIESGDDLALLCGKFGIDASSVVFEKQGNIGVCSVASKWPDLSTREIVALQDAARGNVLRSAYWSEKTLASLEKHGMITFDGPAIVVTSAGNEWLAAFRND